MVQAIIKVEFCTFKKIYLSCQVKDNYLRIERNPMVENQGWTNKSPLGYHHVKLSYP